MNKLFKGTICRVAFQCKCQITGKTGTFLYTGDSCREDGSQCSPAFDSCYYLFEWANQSGFYGIGQDYIYEGKTIDRSEICQTKKPETAEINNMKLSPDEINDLASAQVERENPTPANGFETEEMAEAHKLAHEDAFLELVSNPEFIVLTN